MAAAVRSRRGLGGERKDPVSQSAATAAFSTFKYAADGPLTQWDPTGRNVWNDITGAADGIGDGLGNAAQGIYETATNPIGVVEGLNAACHEGGDGNTLDDALQCVDNLNPVARIRTTLHQSYHKFAAGCTALGERSLFNGVTQAALLLAPEADGAGSFGGVADTIGSRLTAARAEIRLNPEAGGIWLPRGSNAGSAPNFIASSDGVVIPTSRGVLEGGFNQAGLPSASTDAAGTEYTFPDGSLVRVMQSSGNAALRASFTNSNGGPVDAFTDKPVQPPAGLSKSDRLAYVRARTHVSLGP